METNPLQLIAEFQSKPENIDEVERSVLEFVQATRQEDGCTSASFYRVNEEEDRFVFFAEFTGEDALRDHLDAEWRHGAISKIPEMLADTPRRFTTRRVA